MGKPCESINVRLHSVQIQNSKYPSRNPKSVLFQPATVLHIINSAKYSFINENLVRKLLPAAFGSDIPAIDLGNETIVELEWYYPGVKTKEITTHYVLRESRYQITLRKEDWEQPMRNFLLHTIPEKRLRQHKALSPPPPPEAAEEPQNEGSDTKTYEGERDAFGEIESESDAASEPNSSQVFSRPSTAMSYNGAVGECPETCVGDHQSYTHCPRREYAASCSSQGKKGTGATEEVNEAKTVNEPKKVNEQACISPAAGVGQAQSGEHNCEEADDWLQFQIVDTDSEDEEGPEDKKEDSYWTWSRGDSRWFHTETDGSTLWFPKLV